jgi:oligopeptide/dipeptide ABC transporter ATP-binding protein
MSDASGGRPREDAILTVEGLRKHFVSRKGFPRPRTVRVRAVEDVSFSIAPSEAFGLVGESGCGKSTVARALLRLVEPDAGRVLYRGEDLRTARGDALKTLRRKLQIVFQDPYSSLDPRQSIGSALVEPMRVHGIATAAEARRRAAALLEEVGLPPAALDRFPHEFSGGQRQRIGIARALTVEPELIIADEPVSALDVSVQAQVLLLMKELRRRRGLAFLFVSHDLSVVRWFCDRVAVMYLGRIVEEGPAQSVLADPLHPYARMLRDASPVPDPTRRAELPRIVGEIPSAANPPSGCPFHPRCPQAMEICAREMPRWTGSGSERGVACHLHG